VSEGYLRRIVPTTPSDQWNPQIREALCRYLGIRIKVEVQDLFDLSEDRK
jgi:hypothetical protein